MAKERLDLLLVEKGLTQSRSRAQAMIMAGQVFVDGSCIDKAGTLVKKTAQVQIKGKDLAYVGRGGLKLEKALRHFAVDVQSRIALDVGASTGGFTDCFLQHGAKKVFAVDVGYNQLAWKLRTDSRVVVMERTNAKDLSVDHFPEPMEVFAIDVAFISVRKFFHRLMPLMIPTAEGVILVKPQFEAGRQYVGKKGVVGDASVHLDVLLQLGAALQMHGAILGITYSPIRGPQGNIEYLFHFRRDAAPLDLCASAEAAVDEAQRVLAKRGD